MNKFEMILKDAQIPRPYGYSFYFKNYIFNGISLENKTILDLGGGNGIASFFALYSTSSCSAWIVDPIAEGSNQLMTDQYNILKDKIDPARIHFHRDLIDTLNEPEYFDIILMHNSINHIGEDIIEEALVNEEKHKEYVERIKEITDRLKKGGTIIVADCARRNFWGDLGLNSPVAPSIEWNLHCQPNVWQKMIEEAGSVHISSNRTARRELGIFGKILLANRPCSYMLDSHFVSKYQKM